MFKNLNFLRPILAILILFIPLYPKFPLTNVSGTYVAIRLDDIIVAFSVLFWLFFQIKNKFPIFKLEISKRFIFYFLAIIASNLTAILIYQTEPINILILHLLRRFEYMSLFFVTVDTIRNKNDLKFPYIAILISTLLVCLYGYGQKYLSFPIISTMNSEFSKGQLLQMDFWTRISSTFAGHYDLAAFLSVVLIIIGSAILICKNTVLKIFGLIIWLASFHILTLTASRVSVFAFWGGMCLALIFIKKHIWTIPVTLLVLLSIFSSKDLKQRLVATIPAIKKEIATRIIENPKSTPTPVPVITKTPEPTIIKVQPKIINTPTPTIVRHEPIQQVIPIDADVGVARSGEIRFNVEWPRAINSFRKNPITGTGLGSLTLATDNDYLRLLGESGILGFFAFFTVIFYFVKKTLPLIFKKNKNNFDNLNLIFLSCLCTTLANAIFIDVFEASKTAYMFWIMMGIYHQTLKFNQEK